MENSFMSEALVILAPGAQWILSGDNYSEIQWLCDCPKPTAEQVTNKIADLPAIKTAEKETKTAARQSVLNRLGLTEEEAQLILGGSN
jgi:hypothetical protein